MTAMEPAGPASGRGSVCGARLRQERDDGRETCTLARGFKTSHPGFGNCHLHGGATKSGVAAAERERAEQALADAKLTYGLPIDVEPGEALLGLVRTAAGVCAWLGRQVAVLDAEKVTTVDGRTHPLVALYLDERKHLAQVSKDALAAGIAERRIRIEEELGGRLVTFVEGLLVRLGHDPMDPQIREQVRLELAAIDGDAA